MTEQLTRSHERVDDMPLLLAQLDRMYVPQLLDQCFPTHGREGEARESAWVGGQTGRTSSLLTVSTDSQPQVRGSPALRQGAWSAYWLS